MKNVKYFIFFVLLSIICSCNDMSFEEFYEDSYNENYFPEEAGVNSYESMLETLENFEKDLLELNLLEESSVSDYHLLAQSMFLDSNVFIELDTHYLKYNYLSFSTMLESYYDIMDLVKNNGLKIDELYYEIWDVIYGDMIKGYDIDFINKLFNTLKEADIENMIGVKIVIVTLIYTINEQNFIMNYDKIK